MATEQSIPLTTQVRQALAAFLDAHTDAEGKIAAAATLKLTVGGNEADRKRQAASMDPTEYAGYVMHLAEAEKEKAAAVAHLERTEKSLNVLRELLQHASAATNQVAAEIAARTADAYATLQTTPQRPMIHTNGLKRATVAADDDENLPF